MNKVKVGDIVVVDHGHHNYRRIQVTRTPRKGEVYYRGFYLDYGDSSRQEVTHVDESALFRQTDIHYVESDLSKASRTADGRIPIVEYTLECARSLLGVVASG